MNANFYSFNKRKNSTKKPTGGDSRSVLLKDATNLTSPRLELRGFDGYPTYNYVQTLGRYYYITDWRSISANIWECECSEDVLATWIDSVKGQSVYAVRSSAHYNALLDDTRIAPVQVVSLVEDSADVDIISSTPQYFANIVDAGAPTGNTLFYGTSVSNFFKEALNEKWYADLFDKVRGFNPLDMLNEIYLCPLNPSKCHSVESRTADFGTLINTVTISGSSIPLTNATPTGHSVLLDPGNPGFTDFRRSAKYVKYYLHLPFVGVITLPTELIFNFSDIAGDSTPTRRLINIEYVGDCISGAIVYSVRIGEYPLGEYAASLKTPVTLSRQSGHTAEVIAGTVELVGGAALSVATSSPAGAGGIGKGLADIVQGVTGAPEISRIGSISGSIAPMSIEYNNKIRLEAAVFSSSNEPSNLTSVGRPTHKVVSISGGFYQTNNASVSFAGLESEISAFNNALDSGIYVE